uniref:protein-serine/threonine phosphatase n=1 Tax=Phallusia mammillata TaxID=59560 RepID=A0A6F9DPH0_9ASCI|nr:protein phosphatase 1G-like [Phallusia mammillata]
MGAYLSSPALEKASQDFPDNERHICGLSGMQGWRISMEDAHNCIPDVGDGTSLFAVYDGHGGGEVAIYCSLHFADMLKEDEDYKKGNLEKALSNTFMNIDKKIKEPIAKRELKVLSQKDPGDPAPTEDDYKKMEEEEKEDEDETKLLYEEATMNIEDLLARYGRVANETKDIIKNIKEGSQSSEPEKPAPVEKSEVADTTTESKSTPTKAEKEDSKQQSEKTNIEEKKDATQTSASSENTSQLDQKAEGDSLTVETKSPKTVHSIVEEKPTEKPQEATPAKKVLKKTFVKAKPTKSAEAEEDSEDDDYDGFESDEAMGGSSSEEEEEDSEEDDEDMMDEIEIPDGPEEKGKDGAATLAELEALGSGTDEPGSDSGTTAVVALLRENKLHVANAGDSRCVLCRKDGKAFDMSDDHKPEDEKELTRIQNAGGHVNPQGRVNGGLNLSRAIGDHCYKTNKNLPLEEQMISALPDIRSVELKPGDEFMVLACDGIWNVLSSQEVVDFVRERLRSNETTVPENGHGQEKTKTKLSKICEELFDKCIAPNTEGDGTGCDNMTCLIIDFNQDWLQEVSKEDDKQLDAVTDCEKKLMPLEAEETNNHSTDKLIAEAVTHKHSKDIIGDCDITTTKRSRTDEPDAFVNGDSADSQPKRIKTE